MKILLLVTLLVLFNIAFISCDNSTPKTLGDPQNAEAYGYQPIDPLPVTVWSLDAKDSFVLAKRNEKINKQIMVALPDETMRLAIGQIDGKGNISYSSAKMGYAGSSYLVILDYIKFETNSLRVRVKKDSANRIIDFTTLKSNEDIPDAIIPVYMGVGLRLTASVTVSEGNVDLGNLFAIGLAAEAKKVSGTLVIQTLGISGKDISSLIPMPSQINTTTIQNAIMSLASIKTKLYEPDIDVSPRVVGFYNNLGGGRNTVNKFISNILSDGISLTL